jgi:CelD/BcsL family acetyltransferase involved in cellulose biosynthesis
MAKIGELYEQDFFLWTKEQAAALRRAKSSNLPLDWENIAEEIESLGKSDRRELRSQIRRTLRHLFKLDASPAAQPRAGWSSTIREARTEIEDVLRDSPSLRREVDTVIAEQAKMAAELAANDLSQHGKAVEAVWRRLEQGGFTAEQVLGDWFPQPPS